MCDVCRELLSEGLDLCVRARDMDSMDRRVTTLAVSSDPEAWQASGQFARHVERHNIVHAQAPISTRSGTLPLWVQDQYEKDLYARETKSRRHLMQGCPMLADPQSTS